MSDSVGLGPEQVNQFNLQRKRELIDLEVVQSHNEIPLPSWVELSVVDYVTGLVSFVRAQILQLLRIASII